MTRSVTDEELDAADAAQHVCTRCGEPGPTIITAIWAYYHPACYDAMRQEVAEGRVPRVPGTRPTRSAS
jgi:hypothetical protein